MVRVFDKSTFFVLYLPHSSVVNKLNLWIFNFTESSKRRRSWILLVIRNFDECVRVWKRNAIKFHDTKNFPLSNRGRFQGSQQKVEKAFGHSQLETNTERISFFVSRVQLFSRISKGFSFPFFPFYAIIHQNINWVCFSDSNGQNIVRKSLR